MENSSLIEDNKIKHIRNLFGRNKVGKKMTLHLKVSEIF